jgi:copper ion binding protein
MPVTSQYTVTGMTCGHCVQAVTEEISSISGVQKVDVDLSSGEVTVVSDEQLSSDSVASAVDEAGYALAP